MLKLLLNFWDRFVHNPKTTIGGIVTGGALSAAALLVLQQAGCNFDNVQWVEVLGLVFAGPTVVGGVSTDNGKTV